MALPSSGTIKMGGAGTNSIAQEKAGTTSGTPTAVSSVSLKGLSVDGVRDFVSGGSTNVDITGTPDGSTPYKMSEFHGYSQIPPFSFGTPTAPTGSNLAKIFDMEQESRSGNDTCVVCSFNMTLNTSTKAISFSVVGTDDGGGFNVAFTGPQFGGVTYSGVITSLEARFVHSGAAISGSGTGNSANGTVRELFSTTSSLSAANINNNTVTGSQVSTHNDITGGAAGTFRPLRTTSGSMAVALAATSDNGSTDNDASFGSIAYSGSDSITIQLRANGSTLVNLFTKTGDFTMSSETTEEDTS